MCSSNSVSQGEPRATGTQEKRREERRRRLSSAAADVCAMCTELYPVTPEASCYERARSSKRRANGRCGATLKPTLRHGGEKPQEGSWGRGEGRSQQRGSGSSRSGAGALLHPALQRQRASSKCRTLTAGSRREDGSNKAPSRSRRHGARDDETRCIRTPACKGAKEGRGGREARDGQSQQRSETNASEARRLRAMREDCERRETTASEARRL